MKIENEEEGWRVIYEQPPKLSRPKSAINLLREKYTVSGTYLKHEKKVLAETTENI